jgi:D-aminopeptidase
MESYGVVLTGHGGALRGWRSHRVHAAAERLSVVVLFNHHADARGAAFDVLRAALGQRRRPRPEIAYDEGWTGSCHDPRTDLLLDLSAGRKKGQISARFTTDAEMLDLVNENEATSAAMSLRREGEIIHVTRPFDNLSTAMIRLKGASPADVAGKFHSPELDADFHIVAEGSAFFGSFEGFLGKSAAQPIYPVAGDIWRLPCQRSMDAPAPGDWTLHFERDSNSRITAVTVGCWLARKVRFERGA